MMHKAVARDLLRQSGWTEPKIRMALRIVAYDGARAADQIASVISAFADRSDTPSEADAWRQAAAQLVQQPRLAEALFALRSF